MDRQQDIGDSDNGCNSFFDGIVGENMSHYCLFFKLYQRK